MDALVPWLLVGLIPIAMMVLLYRLLARIARRRSTRHGIRLSEEEVKRERVFRDE